MSFIVSSYLMVKDSREFSLKVNVIPDPIGIETCPRRNHRDKSLTFRGVSRS